MAVRDRLHCTALLAAFLLGPPPAWASDPETDDAAETGQLGPSPDAPRDLPLREQEAAAQECYSRAAGRRGAAGARVTVQYHLTAAGGARDVRFVEPAPRDGAARRCILAALRRLRLDGVEVAGLLGDHPEERLLQHTFILAEVTGPAARSSEAVLRILGSSAQGGSALGVLDSLGGPGGLGGTIVGGGGLGVIGTGGLGTLPTATVRTGAPVVRGSLAVEVIRRVLRRHRSGLELCYDTARRPEPTLAGQLSLRLTVGANGAVTAVALAPAGPASAELRACVRGLLEQVVFPAPAAGGVVSVDVPLTFTPPR